MRFITRINRIRNSWLGNILFVISAVISLASTLHEDNVIRDLKGALFQRFKYDLQYELLLVVTVLVFISLFYFALLFLSGIILYIPELFDFGFLFRTVEFARDEELEYMRTAEPEDVFQETAGVYTMPFHWRIIITLFSLCVLYAATWLISEFIQTGPHFLETALAIVIGVVIYGMGICGLGEVFFYRVTVGSNMLLVRKNLFTKQVRMDEILRVSIYRNILPRVEITAKNKRIVLYNFNNIRDVLQRILDLLSRRETTS